MALGSTQPLTEVNNWSISWCKSGRCVSLTTLLSSCAVVTKSGNLNFLEPSGPPQACNGNALPYFTTSAIFYSIAIYFILFHCSVLYYSNSILFYSIMLYSILFHSISFYSILFYFIWFYSILFYSILSYSIIFYPTLSYPMLSYIISYHIISYHIISYRIVSYHITSHHTLYYVLLYYIILYLIISHNIISYPIVSYLISEDMIQPGKTGPVWTGAENLAPHRDLTPDRPARSQSLYRLRYRATSQEVEKAKKVKWTLVQALRLCTGRPIWGVEI